MLFSIFVLVWPLSCLSLFPFGLIDLLDCSFSFISSCLFSPPYLPPILLPTHTPPSPCYIFHARLDDVNLRLALLLRQVPHIFGPWLGLGLLGRPAALPASTATTFFLDSFHSGATLLASLAFALITFLIVARREVHRRHVARVLVHGKVGWIDAEQEELASVAVAEMKQGQNEYENVEIFYCICKNKVSAGF
jgi:hypothetical protein